MIFNEFSQKVKKFMTVIGIDLGATNSCVAVFLNDRVEVITNENGKTTTPTLVAFTNDGILIGDSAKSQMKENAANTVFNFKSLIGRKFSEQFIQKNKIKYPYKIISDEHDRILIEVNLKGQTKKFFPEEIAAIFFSRLKADAEIFLNKKVTEAVISVPANSNVRQRQSTINAAKIAGLNVISLVNDTTAISYSIGLSEISEIERRMFIVDIGSSAFDASIICVDGGLFETLSIAGKTDLGGDDFTDELFKYAVNFLNEKHPEIRVEESAESMRGLRDLCEKAKHALSNEMISKIDCSSLFERKEIEIGVSRDLFDALNEKNFKIISEKIEDVFNYFNLSVDDVTDIYIVGGSSQIPQINKIIKRFFNGKKPSNIFLNCEEVVATGAAYEAAAHKELDNKLVNNILPLDTLSISIGTQTPGQIFVPYIPHNTTIPARKQHTFTTFSDNQTEIEVYVFEGEERNSRDDDLIEKVVVSKIPQAERQKPNIEVYFNIDRNGIFEATAEGKLDDKPIDGLVVNRLKTAFLSDEEVQCLTEKFETLKNDFI